ncbi:cytochrome P450 [Streptomyces sp. TP-A0874]|uniref:cytochrome P450 n=1 Tax=Streptomyces sp. TP-A0874 TaxID=549819 RepID=UPI00147D4914|nr:cytochrome P450 [Streptomyces sp. TP-A0874]
MGQTASVDLLSESFALHPHTQYRALRDTAPVWWDADTACWYVTRYEDVNTLLRESGLSARIGAGFLGDHDPETLEGVADIMRFFEAWPMFTDPPEHTTVRSAVAPSYRPGAVRALRGEIAGRAETLLSRLDPESADLLGEFVQPLAASVTCGLLGIAEERREDLLSWSAEIIGFIGVPRLDPSRAPRARLAISRLREHIDTVTLPDARAGRGPAQLRAFLELDPDRAVALFAQILTGGIEPVAACLGSALVHLLGPSRTLLDQLHRGELEPERLAEEALRLEAPFHFVPRSAERPVELHGQLIEPGQRVALVVAAANRDPEVFTEPDGFRLPERTERPHLAFGAGHHFCLGAGLARLTLAEAIRAVADWLGEGPVGEVIGERVPAFGHTVWQRIGLGY